MTAKKFKEVFTVGHSTRLLDEFVALLNAYRIHLIIDVRSIPRSRHNPQFGMETLARSLPAFGIAYIHMPGLGGLRRAKAGSLNTAWHNASFRGFADYMQTREFVRSLQPLIRHAAQQRAAIMCAEAVPWRCHRSLIADALHVRHFQVRHIITETSSIPHSLTPWAKVEGVKVWYPLAAPGRQEGERKAG
jgi:uncharacterized protein (DUF488 family)